MKALWNWFWNETSKPVFAAILFIGGVVVWGGFNTFMEATNTMGFCISCHEMRDNVYAEYEKTVHYHNRSGVRAICSDCHVPKSWGHKVVRKIKATGELYHWALGTIDTPEKFEAKRLTLARKVWAEMRDNGSRECKNCHAYDAMHWEKQGNRAKKTMKEAKETDIACIDCHKGVAHKLPDFPKYYQDLTDVLKAKAASDPLSTDTLTTIAKQTAYMKKDETSDGAFEVMPLTALKVLERDGDWIKVRLNGWDREGGVQIFKKAGPQMQIAKLGIGGMDVVKQTEEFLDKETELTWNKVHVDGWLKTGALVSDGQVVDDYAAELNRTDCGMCHTRYEGQKYNARDWTKKIKAMRRFTKLELEQLEVVQLYLQDRSSDMTKAR